MYYLRDICLGKRKRKSTTDCFILLVDIKAANVKVLTAPNYEGLAISDFLAKAEGYAVMKQYLPEKRDIHRLPRNFIVNLLYTLIGDEIKHFVKGIVEIRNQAVVENQRMALELDDDIRRAFEVSTTVTCR